MATNADKPRGFVPVKYLNGSPWNGKARVYYCRSDYATALFIGDTVKSGGNADTLGKYATVEQAGAGGNVRGVVIAFGSQPSAMFDADDLNRKYKAASTAMYCLVVDDPNVIFEVQEDNDSATLAATDVGGNADAVLTAGDTNSGISKFELDSSGVSGTAVAQCRILGLADREDNAMGDYAKWEIIFNEHELKATAGVD